MSEREEAGGVARGGEDLTPPIKSLDDAPKELVRELLEAKVPWESIEAVLDVRPRSTDKRLTAPLAIRGRRGRIAIMELYGWAHPGLRLDDLVSDLNYLTGITPRTLKEYWDGIRRKGGVRELNGRVARLET